MENNAMILHQIVHGKEIMNDLLEILNRLYQQKKQVTILHISDEFGMDDIHMYNHPAVKKVLRNYWRPDLVSNPKVQFIPLGFANDRAGQSKSSPSFEERKNIWAFAGSLDRPGRQNALEILRKVGPHEEQTKPTWSSPAKLTASAYVEHLRNAKFVPCFAGSKSIESYRFYEAIEHGAIPIYVPNNCSDEYTELYGKHPFLGFPSWEKVAEMLPLLVNKPKIMEKHREKLREWWSEKKREIRLSLSQ
jgi:hypothetical protein